MKVTPGKQKGVQAVSDSRGVIAAAAMDQRGSLMSAIAKAKGVEKKQGKGGRARGVQDHRGANSSRRACQRDPARPQYGLPAAKARARNAGLLLAYENSWL